MDPTVAKSEGFAAHAEAIRLHPASCRYAAPVRAFQAKRDYDRAIADYVEPIRLDPQGATLYLTPAHIYRFLSLAQPMIEAGQREVGCFRVMPEPPDH